MKYPDFTSATCSGIGLEFFFPEEKGSGTSVEERMARRICFGCPVLEECGEWGMKHELYGIWGGMSPRERMMKRRKAGIIVQQILVSDYVNTK
jgi:WhiB family redox-sensing transcriptional regulator